MATKLWRLPPNENPPVPEQIPTAGEWPSLEPERNPLLILQRYRIAMLIRASEIRRYWKEGRGSFFSGADRMKGAVS